MDVTLQALKDIMYKKIPPFGKPLSNLQGEGLRPSGSVFLYIGLQAWKKGQERSISFPQRTLVLPPYESPFVYNWPVEECDVLILDFGYPELDYIEDVVLALYQNKAEIVRYLSPANKLTVYYKD